MTDMRPEAMTPRNHAERRDEKFHPDRYLKPEQAAAMMGIRPGTLAHWRVDGRGPRYSKIGSAVRYSEQAVLSFMAATERGGAL